MSHPKVVAFAGAERAGKDTAAAGLVNRRGAVRLAFADGVKQALEILDPILPSGMRLGFALHHAGGWEALKASKTDYPELVRLQQRLATNFVRERIDEDAWARPVVQEARERVFRGELVTISDLRYPNEASALREAFGDALLVVEVIRPGVRPVNGHDSAKGLPRELIDHTVTNDSTPEELHQRTEALLGLTRQNH